MRILWLLFLLTGVSCHEQKVKPIDNGLQTLKMQLANQTDSLAKVKVQVLKFANLYVNDMNNKMNEDSMEYWSSVQKGLLGIIAGTRYTIDSLLQTLNK